MSANGVAWTISETKYVQNMTIVRDRMVGRGHWVGEEDLDKLNHHSFLYVGQVSDRHLAVWYDMEISSPRGQPLFINSSGEVHIVLNNKTAVV